MASATGFASDRLERIDFHYHIVRNQLLSRQSSTLGLFPSLPSEFAWVRENVYCAAAVWALSLAYRRIDDDRGRTYELEQSAVKCMRGILFCYMRQSEKLERFKRMQSHKDALHCRFHHLTGDADEDSDYGHLQIDATSLYLIFLSQMITSGLQIIYTMDEVNFIQNLVYYIERAYRTPDYGMWERGSKDNNNTRELNGSSIGLAKGALEIINGLDLFGSQGSLSSTVYVDPDAHNRNRTILGSLLPRESSSKETDAALLAVVGYPAFAIDNPTLRKETKERILDKLQGKYGLKRFPKDGQYSGLESKGRRFYCPSELRVFDKVECEWPLLFVYLFIEALFHGDKPAMEVYWRKIQFLMVSNAYGYCLPKFYFVPEECTQDERANPGSQRREPDPSPTLFLWGNALYIIASLLKEELVSPGELDPLERRISPLFRTNSNKRHSNLKTARSDVIVQIALIAESSKLQTALSTYGIATQTLEQIEPIQLHSPSALVEWYCKLGVNSKLGLSGRPERPIGPLGSSKMYRILGQTVVFYPIILDQSDFYMSHDMLLLLHNIQNTISFIHENWNMEGRPTVVLLLRENTIKGANFSHALELLAAFKKGECSGARVRLGRLQQLLSTSCCEHLDFLVERDPDLADSLRRDVLTPPLLRTRSRSSLSAAPGTTYLEQDSKEKLSHKLSTAEFREEDVKNWPDHEIVSSLDKGASLDQRLLLLQTLYSRHGLHYRTDLGSLGDLLESLYQEAGDAKRWRVVRLAASLLEKLVDSIAPSISTMLVSGKQVTLGVFGQREHVISEPLGPFMIKDILYKTVLPHSVYEAVMQQEMLIFLASIISAQPRAFEGMLRLRVGWILEAMRNILVERNCEENISTFSPNEIKTLLIEVLMSLDKLDGRSWLKRRQLSGSLNKVPLDFYPKVYAILEKTPRIKVFGNTLEQYPLIDDMSSHDMTFSLKVEETLQDISFPEYRQIVVELLIVIYTVLQRNAEVEFRAAIDLDELIGEALTLYANDNSHYKGLSKTKVLTHFYNVPPYERGGTTSYLARAVANQVLQGTVRVDSESVVNCCVQ
ncbi:phosphorylase b kinase regulatory subunit beta-like [Oscarella lobularis]|uniref:phosphorylase b kinase regulatory subunit beta-like n=1 Tax=Oscarella lobularis TaxID=121494 RepID=UPI0033130A16